MLLRTDAPTDRGGPDLEPLRRVLRGPLLSPDTPGYDEARALWNGMIDKRPLGIARCENVDDVVAAVTFARRHDLALAVRGGGHNVAGFASVGGGLVIDLSSLNGVAVDAANRTARVGGGATLGDLDRATQAFGLAVPSGLFSRTGVAGLTLGGGLGWLRRKYGLTCDNLVGATVVTAAGAVVRASETENADLLWGLRGGGGNFGVVTEFVFRLFPVGPEVAFAFTFYPLEAAKRVVRAHERFLEGEPGDVSTLLALGRTPHAEPFPTDLHGTPYVGVLALYAGDPDAGMQVLQPLRELAEPLVDLSGPMRYLEAQTLFDADYPDGGRYYWKSATLSDLPDPAVDLLVRAAEQAPSEHSTIDVWVHGGAVARPGAGATAYGRRDARYLVTPEANWTDPADDAANLAWARGCLSRLGEYAAGGAYLNFPGFGEEGDALTRSAYGDNLARLRALKTEYDPHNVFRHNQNIRPLS